MRILVHICCAPCFSYLHKRLTEEKHELVGYFFNPNIHPYQEFLRRLHCMERYTALRPVELIVDKEYDLSKYMVGALQAMFDPAEELMPVTEGTELEHEPEKIKLDKTNRGTLEEHITMKDSLTIQLRPRGPGEPGGSIESIDVLGSKTPADDKGHQEGKLGKGFNTRCAFCIRLRMARTAKRAKRDGFEGFTTTLLLSKYQPHEYIKATGEKLAEKYGITFYYEDFRTGWKESIRLSKEMELYRQQYCGCIFSEYERYR